MLKIKLLQPEVSDASEVLQLKLWDGFETTNTVFDYSLNGNSGTVSGATITDKGLLFDGSTDKVVVPADPTIDINGKTVLSISAWINPASDGEGNLGRIVDKGALGLTGYYLLVRNEGVGVGLEFAIALSGDNVSAQIDAGVPLNIWTHVVATYNEDGDKKGKIYVNAILQSLDVNTPGTGVVSDDSAVDFAIGSEEGGQRAFDGSISDVRIWPNARSAIQIRDFYEQTRWRYGV